MKWLRKWWSHKREGQPRCEDPAFIRLVEAEAELEELKKRAEVATHVLNKRDSKNHWRESIEALIQSRGSA